MALYIDDKLVISSAKTEMGIDTIIRWLEDKIKYKPTIDSNSDRIMILTMCMVHNVDSDTYSAKAGTTTNPVTIYDDRIIINPAIDYVGENITKELCEFVKSLRYIIRDEKINEILK